MKMRCVMAWTLAVCGLLVVAPVGAGAQGVKTAVFPFDFIDDSHEGELNGIRADETKRLALIGDELVRLLKADGRYDPVDMAPLKDEITKAAPIYKCNGCEDKLAKAAGAKLAIICTVQKVSNLILNMNLFVRDSEHEKTLRQMSVDLRGNTDESWIKSLQYIVKNRLFADEASR